MKNSVDIDTIEDLTSIYSNITHAELCWILSELQRFPTNFARRIHTSPSTLKNFGKNKNQELPLFVVLELANLCGSETHLKYLRFKYSQQQIKNEGKNN